MDKELTEVDDIINIVNRAILDVIAQIKRADSIKSATHKQLLFNGIDLRLNLAAKELIKRRF